MSDENMNNALTKAQYWSNLFLNISIIVTEAVRGGALFHQGKLINVPTTPILSKNIFNPVGAGDMFSAEVAMELFNGKSIKTAISLAHTSTAKILISSSNLTKFKQ